MIVELCIITRSSSSRVSTHERLLPKSNVALSQDSEHDSCPNIADTSSSHFDQSISRNNVERQLQEDTVNTKERLSLLKNTSEQG